MGIREATVIVGFLLTGIADAAPPKPLKVLIVTGGCCHDYDVQKVLLKKGLEQRAYLDVEYVQQGGTATDSRIPLYENANWADGFDCVIHDECFSDAKDPQWVARVLKPHREGLPAVVMHCAMHCYRDGSDEWFKFCGVTSRQHGAHYPHEVLTRDGSHPIMKTLGAGWANPAGELYWIEKVWPTAHPLASAKNREKGNEEVCVWTNEFGEKKTRVFGTTLGHHNVTVEHPQFLDLVTRGTLWACGKLDDTYLKPVVAQRVPVNLALNKSAKASSEETGKNNFAKHAIDGNEGTRWCAANGSFPQTLEIDLGAVKTITGCGFKWESTQTYQFRLEGSSDGQKWTTLSDQTKAGNNVGETRFDQRAVRHLKLTVTGTNAGGWASLWEWSVFGTETVAVDPDAVRKRADQAVLSDVKIPDGLEATVFATPPAVNYPVFVAAAPDGTVYVSSDKNGSLDREARRGSILRLRDLDGDGRADESKLFVADVDSPRGLVWDRDRLYVMHPPHLSAFIDKDGDGISDEQKILVKNIAFGFKDRPADHTSNGVTLGIDGWLYLAIGDFGFMEAEGTDGRKLQFRGGGVIRVRPDGTQMEIFSRGTRNILEVALDPLLNGFTRDNTNDGDGWDIRLHHFTGLEHHGYPSLYKNFSDEAVQPLADYGGGSGCGAMFLAEPGFPDGYSPALYTADWGRNWVYRHRMTPNGATFKPDQHEFIGSTRVTDLDVDASSRLYVTSWKGATFTYAGEDVGYLLQFKPKGYTAPALPDYLKLSDEQLVEELKSPSHRRRLAAQRELLARPLSSETRSKLKRSVIDKQVPLETRVAALFAVALTSVDSAFFAEDMRLFEDDAAILPYVLRAWGDRGANGPHLPKSLRANAMQSTASVARRECAAAVGRLPEDQNAWLDVFNLGIDSDPIVRHTAAQALIAKKAGEFTIFQLKCTPAPEPKFDWLIGAVVQTSHDPNVVAELIEQVGKSSDSPRRRMLLTALCRLHQREGTWKGNSWGTRPDTTGPYFQPETWEESPRIAAALKRRLEAASPDEAAFLLAQLNRHKISLDGALDRLLTMAAKDTALIPAAVTELSRAKTVPTNAIGLLKQVAADKERPQDQRLAAALAWMRARDDASFPGLLRVLPTLDDKAKRRDLNALWSAFLNVDRLSPHATLLVEQSQNEDKELALWATAGLWALTSPKGKPSPEVRAVADKAIDAAALVPAKRQLAIEALRVSNQREFADTIQRAVSDDNPNVAELARDVAKQWKLELSPTLRGPKVSTLKPEDVLTALQKQPGKAGPGEALYAKLNCAKCHTVKDGEPLRGPFLPNVAKTYKREQLAEAVLLPSKSLAQGFVTYVFTMDSGKTMTGFVTSEAAEAITIRDNEGKEFTLPVKEIEERAKSTVSVMPEGLVKDLTVDEFASLIAYLESLAPPK